MKKGQISIFILIGAMILIATILFFTFLRSPDVTKETIILDSALDMNSINIFIEKCLYQTTVDGLSYLENQGGYYSLPENSDSIRNMPFFYLNKTLLVPEKETIENELKTYVDSHMSDCLNEFGSFSEIGKTVYSGSIKSKITINSKDITCELNFPIGLREKNSINTRSNFQTTVKTLRIPDILYVSKEIVKEIHNGNGTVCMSCLDLISANKNIEISFAQTKNNTAIFQLTDMLSTVPKEYINGTGGFDMFFLAEVR